MDRSPYFRCVFDLAPTSPPQPGPIIRGRFEIRRPSVDDPTRSEFSEPIPFQYDTGATSSVVSEAFAVAHGFGDFRSLGVPTMMRGFDQSAAPLRGWRVFRWVRFRDYDDGISPFPATDPGGLEHLEFRISLLVVPGVILSLPLIGLHDLHTYFTVGSGGEEYVFFPRNTGGTLPSATDGGQGVREIP